MLGGVLSTPRAVAPLRICIRRFRRRVVSSFRSLASNQLVHHQLVVHSRYAQHIGKLVLELLQLLLGSDSSAQSNRSAFHAHVDQLGIDIRYLPKLLLHELAQLVVAQVLHVVQVLEIARHLRSPVRAPCHRVLQKCSASPMLNNPFWTHSSAGVRWPNWPLRNAGGVLIFQSTLRASNRTARRSVANHSTPPPNCPAKLVPNLYRASDGTSS